MSRLADQEVTIQRLAQTAEYRHARAMEACRSINLPINLIMKSAGAALLVAEIVPGLFAYFGFIFGKSGRGRQPKRLLRVILESPRLVHATQRILLTRSGGDHRR